MASLDKLSGVLTKKSATHLLRRTTFGPSREDIDAFTGMTVDAALDILFATKTIPSPPVDTKTGTTWLNPRAGSSNSKQEDLINYFMSWHLEQMLKSGSSVKEKIVFFFHSHLPVNKTLITDSEAIYYQNALYRHFAFASYKDLFKKICIDNAMLIYLNGNLNQSSSPNENFAREMFELYSIGRGVQIGDGNYTNYTEDDIKAATRVLTGWTNDDKYTNVDVDTNLPIGKLLTAISGINEVAIKHDANEKTFSPAFNNTIIKPDVAKVIDGYETKEAATTELNTMIDLIFDQDATAQFITRKIYRHFVYYIISDTVESDVIKPLASEFKTSGYNMVTLLRKLFSSVHFFDTDNVVLDDDNVGALIKSPIELVLGSIRAFNINVPNISTDPSNVYKKQYIDGIINCLVKQGMPFYEPFDVAGYPAYHQFPTYTRNWITPVTIAYRYMFSDLLMNGVNLNGGDLGFKLDILTWVDDSKHISDPSSADTLVSELLEFLVPFTVSTDRKNYFINDVLLLGLGYSSAWTAEWNTYKSDGSNVSTVRNILQSLVSSVLKSPEYQLM